MIKYLFIFLSAFSFAQQTQFVDFLKCDALLNINPIEKSISGSVSYSFKVLKDIDSIKIDSKNIDIFQVNVNDTDVDYKLTNTHLILYKGYKKGENYVYVKFKATPKQTLYFTDSDENLQIWTQGQGKYTSHWLPSFDDVNEKVIFNLSIESEKQYQVISNGRLISTNENGNLKTWQYQMQQPISSYLVMLAIGNFDKQSQKSTSGIPLEMYYQPKDKAKFEPTYRYSKAIFDFLEKEIGVKYPWEIYKQVPVRDFLYAGMENTSATVFAQDFVVDSIGFNDKNYINVNAHELAHQWFGNLITAKSGKDHWLQEGFATYYALLAEQSLFGEDHFNWQLYEMAERLQQASRADTIPILNEKASALTFYQKGAWALHVLREGVGHEKFQRAVKNYLKKYQFQNVTSADFLEAINAVSNYDTNIFRKRWLENPKFEVEEALQLLKKNKLIQEYFKVAEMKDVPLSVKKAKFESVLKSRVLYPLKEEIIYQLQDVPFNEKEGLLRLAMQTNDLKVRQVVAQSVTEFPLSFKSEYETLLTDKSYITQEIALHVLWSRFPEEQIQLLEKTQHWIGFNDKNLRILWLTLALKTKDYPKDKKLLLYQELLDYATPKFESSTRQNALTNLIYLDKNDQNYLVALVNALTDHKWQIVKFAKDNIRKMLKSKNHRIYFESLLSGLNESEQLQLNKLLKE